MFGGQRILMDMGTNCTGSGPHVASVVSGQHNKAHTCDGCMDGGPEDSFMRILTSYHALLPVTIRVLMRTFTRFVRPGGAEWDEGKRNIHVQSSHWQYVGCRAGAEGG